MREAYKECAWMYETNPDEEIAGRLLVDCKGTINYTVWSDVLICPHCGEEIVFYDAAADPKTGKVVPAKARNARITGYAETLLKITLHDGTSFQCTPDHKIMLRDCTFTEAKDLKIGDSLMPMYYKFMNAD